MKKVIFIISAIGLAQFSYAQTINYVYDKLGRLTQAAYPDSSIIKYTYDASGNRLSLKVKDINYHIKQVLSFNPLANVVYGVADITPVVVSSNSSLPISFSSDNTTLATITAGGKIHVNGAGTVNIIASQIGDSRFLAAVPVSQTLVINKAPLTITANNQSRVYKAADPQFTVSYAGLVNGDTPIKLTVQPTVTATATLTANVGSYPLTAAGGVSPNYTFVYVPGVLTISPATRVITFGPIPVKTYLDADFDPGATLDSGEPVVYTSSNPGVATIVNNKIRINGAGTAIITAAVGANPNYLATAPVGQLLTVNKAQQTIDFGPLAIQKQRGITLPASATASSGLIVALASSEPAVAQVVAGALSLRTVGSTTITATQAGNANFLPAKAVSQLLRIESPEGERVLVHRILSPNGDGINDVLLIEGIKDYPDNHVLIVDRNGVKVFERNNYDNSSNVFDGHSSINGSSVPQGPYFFRIQYRVDGQLREKTDFFELKL